MSIDRLKQLGETLIVSLTAIFAPIKTMMVVTLVLIIVDLVTGLVAAFKNKEPITSAGLRRTMSKLFVYEIALMVAFLCEKYMQVDFIPLVKVVCTLISVVELKSIYENLNIASGTNLLQDIIDKLGSSNPGIK